MLVASCIISAMMLYNYDRAKFAVAIIPTAVFAVIFFIDLALAEKNSLKFIAKLNEAVGTAENEALYYFETPSVIVDSDFRVLWCNKEFNDQIIPEYDIFGTEIYKAVDIDIKALMLEGAATVFFGDRSFKVGAVATQRYDQKLIFMSFTDITEFAELFSKYKRTRPSVLLLVIDNYEDVLQNFKESEKAQVAAAIETMLEDFMSQTTGVLRKLGHDKFIAVIEEQHLNNIIQSKFEILDKARNISIGEKSSIITLSIGVGRGASTLEESETFAKQALDMCLGRGGDQAAVKTENGFRFFGGVANGVEKKSRAKSRIISNAIQELVHNSDNVYIMGHRFADLDAVGAGAGLAGAVRQAGGEAYFVVDPIKNLAGGLIERLYSEIPDLLITPQQAVENFSENSLLIIVDTHNAELVESRELHDMAVHKIVIDHHRKSVNFIDDAVIFYHEPYSSSASEMVTEVIQYFKNVSFLPQVYAEALLAGIMLDTKNFIMKTGVRTFEAAAYLRKNGADTVKVKGLFTNSIEAYRKKSALISTAEIFDRCAIAVSDSKSDDIRIIAPQAADELLGISGVDASFVIYKTGDVVNISARSLGVMNVQVIMERLGGGGHQTMAAAQLTDVSEQKAKEMLIEVLDQD
ncbi:MAG: DHH family phosphoesterase [Ruminococcus sp.]|nr:DHH family phosphoesterase [Ruminococcus sp.]